MVDMCTPASRLSMNVCINKTNGEDFVVAIVEVVVGSEAAA